MVAAASSNMEHGKCKLNFGDRIGFLHGVIMYQQPGAILLKQPIPC
jgi:hypothetical protein